MRIIIHADPGEAGLKEANRVRDKIVRRVAQADGIVEVVQAEEPVREIIQATATTTTTPMQFYGSDEEGAE